MPDWQELVRQRLAGLALGRAEKQEVHAELAAHLEESYEVFSGKACPSQTPFAELFRSRATGRTCGEGFR